MKLSLFSFLQPPVTSSLFVPNILLSILFSESQKVRNHWEDQDVGGWSILKLILERYDAMVWI
jgi:hypothetical protein